MNRMSEPAGRYFDEDGFLRDPNLWNREIALKIAGEEGLDHLDHDQWVMIAFLRRYYFKYFGPPVMHYICHVSQLGPQCGHALFDKGTVEAWRIAGLPNPGEEAKAYM